MSKRSVSPETDTAPSRPTPVRSWAARHWQASDEAGGKEGAGPVGSGLLAIEAPRSVGTTGPTEAVAVPPPWTVDAGFRA